MKVTFTAADPREKARPLLDTVLQSGVDQVAIACAFLTPGGVRVLKRHAVNLNQPNSFVVVAWENPTTLETVETLHELLPGKVYLHLGAETPHEKRVGRGLMHSKVFFARTGQRCWLWTGSHNLTASAALGVNCEAAVVLEGTADEQPFQDALAHLNQCRREAVQFDPYNPPPAPNAHDTLVVHAECGLALRSCPWFVHLRPTTTKYDRIMRPPASVWLYLYQPGSLHPGARRPPAVAAFSGKLTALNFTEHHPMQGIPAAWDSADYVIEQRHGVFHLTSITPQTNTPTQGVLRLETSESPRTVWLTQTPTPELTGVVGEAWSSELDSEFRNCFSAKSIQAGRLIHRPYRALKPTVRVPTREVGALDSDDIRRRLALSQDAQVTIEDRAETDDATEYMYRAKYPV